jgi:hypothetical protein
VSLIDDALKRAAQGSPVPGEKRPAQSPLPLPDRGRHAGRRTRLIVVVLAAVGLALLLFALLPRRSAQTVPRPAPEGRAAILAEATPEPARTSPAPTPDAGRDRAGAAAAYVGEVVVPPPPRVVVESPAQSAAPAPPPPPVVEAPSTFPATREAASITRIDPPTPMIASASSSPAIVRAPENRARPSSSRARTFVREGTFSSGGQISLDGIVYSDDNPAAVINGRVVTVGGYVDGREVLRIRPDRVELQDGSTTLVLLLK